MKIKNFVVTALTIPLLLTGCNDLGVFLPQEVDQTETVTGTVGDYEVSCDITLTGGMVQINKDNLKPFNIAENSENEAFDLYLRKEAEITADVFDIESRLITLTIDDPNSFTDYSFKCELKEALTAKTTPEIGVEIKVVGKIRDITSLRVWLYDCEIVE